MDKQEMLLDMPTLVMDSPHRQDPEQLEDRDLATVSPVTVRCTQGSHTHIQDTLRDKLDLNKESQDPQFREDTELLMDRQEMLLDMPTLVMDSPHREGPGQLEVGVLATMRPVTVRCTQGSHTHIQDTLRVKSDLTKESQDPQFREDTELLMDRQEMLLDMPTLVMASPHREGPGQLEVGVLATVSPVTVRCTQGSHTHIQDTLRVKSDLNMESQDPQFREDTELLMDRQEMLLDMPTLVMDSPHREGPGQLEVGVLATMSPVTVRCTQGSHTHIQDTRRDKLDLNKESQDPQFREDTELLMDKQEMLLDMPTLVMDSPHREGPGQLEDRDLATVSPVTVRCTQGSHTHIQDTLRVKSDLNMESQDPQFREDTELLMDRQEMLLDMPTLVMDSPHREVPGQLALGDQATKRPVTVRCTQGSHTDHTHKNTLRVKSDLNMESQDPQFREDTELLMDRQEMLLDMPTLVMASPHREGPGQLEVGVLATMSPVTVRCTQGSHTHIQDTLRVKSDLNMESQDPQFREDTELLMDRQEMLLDMPTLVMDSPHREGPGQLEVGDLATMRPVTVRCTQGSHTDHTHKNTLRVKSDLNMESQDPQFREDTELLMDRQEIALDVVFLGMDNPHRPGPDLPEQVIFSHMVVKGKGMDQVKLGNMAAMDLQTMTMGTRGMGLLGTADKAARILTLHGSLIALQTSHCLDIDNYFLVLTL
uniref:uncharacterized protein LOC128930150 n=1 Tax=Callithrix jacchus TaxID=9483 RepID=UPI0023DCF3C8|nr:uncharacterized protein LOC128930150 [Callithrix jacchus]